MVTQSSEKTRLLLSIIYPLKLIISRKRDTSLVYRRIFIKDINWEVLCHFVQQCDLIVFVSPGMVLSVFVVLLLTVFYELLKVSRVWLGTSSKLAPPQSPCALPATSNGDFGSVLNTSEVSLTHVEPQPATPNTRNRSVGVSAQVTVTSPTISQVMTSFSQLAEALAKSSYKLYHNGQLGVGCNAQWHFNSCSQHCRSWCFIIDNNHCNNL